MNDDHDVFFEAFVAADRALGKVPQVLNKLSKSDSTALLEALFEVDSALCAAQQVLIEPGKAQEIILNLELKRELMKQGAIVFDLQTFCKAKQLQSRIGSMAQIFENKADF
jgi:hypothetical protein